MITKKEALEIALAYIKLKKRTYIEIVEEEKVDLDENSKVLYRKRKGEFIDIYTVWYTVQWAIDEKTLYMQIAADTGEVLYTMTPTAIVEDFEK